MKIPSAIAFSLLLALPVAGTAEPYSERADVRQFVAGMSEKHGLDADELLAHFRKAKPDPVVLKAIAPPPRPGVRSWRVYRSRFVEPTRIGRGLGFWTQHADTLARAEEAYGVPAEIIVAIIGVETIYGKHTGRFHVFNALTTLSFDYPARSDLFRSELEALLLLAHEECRDPWSYLGSYAGAIGLPQFLPSSLRNYAIDFNGDGRIDLAGSPDDAIGSVARFLRAHGWEPGAAIALPVAVSGDVATLVEEGILPQRLPSQMAELGVKADGAPDQPAALIDLVTPNATTEYRLGFNNFYVLTRYNRSTFYATAVLDLATVLRSAR